MNVLSLFDGISCGTELKGQTIMNLWNINPETGEIN